MSKKIILIILAAGESRRFGGNKLLYPVNGKPLYQYISTEIEKLPKDLFHKKIVVSQYPEIINHLSQLGYLAIENKKSFLGISHSIHLAVEVVRAETDTLEEERNLCFMVCDQPFLKAETIEGLINEFRKTEKEVACLCSGEDTGNPVIFSGKYESELMELRGDTGGKKVLNRHREKVYFYEVKEKKELMDVDYRDEIKIAVKS